MLFKKTRILCKKHVFYVKKGVPEKKVSLKKRSRLAGGSLKTSYGLRGPCLLPQAPFFPLFGTFQYFQGAKNMKKHDLETPSTIKITLKGFEWSNFQLKTRKANLILIGLSVKKQTFRILERQHLVTFWSDGRREPQLLLLLHWSHFTEPLGKVKFLHCLRLCSGLQVKETHTNQCCGKNQNVAIEKLHILIFAEYVFSSVKPPTKKQKHSFETF